MDEKTLIPFKGTVVQEEQLKEVIAKHRDQKGGLMPVLQEAQGIYGYLPIEVQTTQYVSCPHAQAFHVPFAARWDSQKRA